MLSGALQQAGHQVRQYDLLAAGGSADVIANALKDSCPDVVCVSVRNMDNVDSLALTCDCRGLDLARNLIARIRQDLSSPIIAGGSGFSIAPGVALDYLGADYGIVGEGERLLPNLIHALEAGETCPQLSIARNQPLNFEETPPPLHDPALIHFYLEKSGIVGVQTKRGCPMHCAYCTYPLLEGECIRARTPDQIIEELRRLHRDFGVQDVFFTDSIFNDPQGRFRMLAEAMIQADLPVRWGGYFTPFRLNDDDLTLCKRSGLFAAELGTDASSDATLAGMHKSFSWAEVHRATEAFAKAEIPCAQFVMFGGPSETMATLTEGLQNIAGLPRTVVFGFSGIRAFPGTAIWARGVEDGLFAAHASALDSLYYISPALDKNAMDQRIEASWAGRPDRVFPPEQGARIVKMLRAFGHKGLLWDKLLNQGTSHRALQRRLRKLS